MRKSLVVVTLFVLCLAGTAFAQQFDAAFGVGTVQSSQPSNFNVQSVGGGAFPAFSADFLMHNGFGFGGEVAWRASQNLYFGSQPYRPIFYDFNAVYSPMIGGGHGRYRDRGPRIAPELQAGIGGESVRFYGALNCSSSFSGCTNYVSSNHFLGHVGGGLKLYVTRNFFIKPEAHAYFVNNNFEFSSGTNTRYGVSIGYTLGQRDY